MARLTDQIEKVDNLNNDDLIHVVDVSDTTSNPAGTSFKLKLATLKAFILNALTLNWGSITGNITDQADLQSALIGKANSSHTHTAAQVTDFTSASDARVAAGIASHVGLSDPHTQYQKESEKDAASGYAGLDPSGKINPAQLPAIAITDTFVVASQAAQVALTAEVGDIAVRSDQNKTYILRVSPASTFSNWQELSTPTDAVQSVFGRTNTVTAQNGDYNAAQITNTPAGNIAAVTVQAAINELDAEKAPLSHTHTASQITDFAANVRSTVLTGISFVSSTVITATDTVVVAVGSLQKQISDLVTLVANFETTAQLNTRDTNNRNRANHTGTQPAATITGLAPVATSGDYNDLDNLPDLSLFDDVDQFVNFAAFPGTGNVNKFYLAQDTGIMYRWTGSGYSVISAELALGETSSTAYRGDRGKIAYDHSQVGVAGPASAVDGALPIFDGTTGKLVKSGSLTWDESTKTIDTDNGAINVIELYLMSGLFRGALNAAASNLSADRSYIFPDMSGIVALLTSLSVDTSPTSGPASYDSNTGVFTIPDYSAIAGGVNLTEVEIDMGDRSRSGKFTITDPTITIDKKILVFPSPNEATDRRGNDWEADVATMSGLAKDGELDISIVSPYFMRGKRKVYYQVV